MNVSLMKPRERQKLQIFKLQTSTSNYYFQRPLDKVRFDILGLLIDVVEEERLQKFAAHFSTLEGR